MSRKTTEQKRARALQKHTGWSYTECLRAVRGPEAASMNLLDPKAKATADRWTEALRELEPT